MEIRNHVSVTLSEEETYAVLEDYVRRKALMEGSDLHGYTMDDCDPACRNGKGATSFFVQKE